MPKLYFQNESDSCYTLDYHLEYMKKNCISEMVVFEAKRETGGDYFFCKAVGEAGMKGQKYDPCGKMCDNYEPRNGNSGCCKHYGFTYEQTDISKTLKI